MMKTIKFRFLTIVFSILFFSSSFAQIDDVTKMLSGFSEVPEDVGYLLDGYLTPYLNAFGTNLNAGWYNTAKPHKLGGFDLTITFNGTFIPTADKVFDLTGLKSLTPVNSDLEAPSVAGKGDGVPISYIENFGGTDLTIADFETPAGTGVSLIPTPNIQVGIGLVKGTEILGRYVPTLKIGDLGKLGLWGFGIKHDIKQWIPVVEKLPVLNISILGGYTKYKSTVGLSLNSEDFNTSDLTVTNNSTITSFSDQELLMGVKSFTLDLLVSADIPVVTFYGGFGIGTVKSNIGLNGTFPLPEVNSSGTIPYLEVTDVSLQESKDPVDIDNKMKYARANIGMRLKLGVLTLHGDYTLAKYKVVTAGIGISFR